MWLKPEKWNQGGYDAVFIDHTANLLRFVQVTTSHKHEFKSEYFNSLIDKIGLPFKTIEVYFVVPEDKLAGFLIPQNGHLRTCPFDIKCYLLGAGGAEEGKNCCVGWRKVAALDWSG